MMITRVGFLLACLVSVFAADGAIRISFQPPRAPIMDGWQADTGDMFATHGTATFGWNAANPTGYDRGEASAPDQTHDTLLHMQRPENPDAVWEIALPNGFYQVRLICGDAMYCNSVLKVAVEEVLLVNDTPSASHHWVTGQGIIEVRDGRLTISNATGAVNNKICGVEIIPVATNG